MDDTTEKHLANRCATLARHLIFRIRGMLSIEPIIGNVIAIALAIGVLALLNHHEFFPSWLHGKWGLYLGYAVQTGIVIQFLKSASCSIILPVLALSFAAAGFALQNFEPDVHLLTTTVLQQCMFLGVLGMVISIYKIG
jgi:hypothetical protein